MTINTTASRNEYTGDDSTDTYSYSFKIFNQNHLEVIVRDPDGLEEILDIGTDYTVAGVGNKNGGTITLLAGNLLDDYFLVIRRFKPLLQETSIKNQNDFYPEVHEDKFDSLVMNDQQLQDQMDRTLKVSKTSNFNGQLPSPIPANSVIITNEDGDGLEFGPNIFDVPFPDYVETIDATDYTATPELSDYDPATNKIIFTDNNITDLKSIVAGSPGERLMIVNATGATIMIANEDPLETALNRISTGTGQDTELPNGSGFFFNYDGQSDTWRIVGGTGGGAGVLLGLPTDGEYGGPIGPIAGLALGDRVEDAFDKVDTILGLLAPPPPEPLSAKTLLIPSSYAAREATSGTLHPIVVNSTTPVITPGQTETLADSFRDGKAGVLSAEIDSVEVGSITLTASDDSGTDGQLQILFDFDPYDGVFGQQGFWEGIVARINATALSVGNHIAELIHTLTGTASIDFWVDDAVTPTVNNGSLSYAGTSSHRSGVPGIAAGQNITVEFDVEDAVKTHYNNVRIGRVESAQTANVNAPLPGSPPAPDATIPISVNVVANSGAYSENISFTARGYNSADGTANISITDNFRIDTVGSEAARSNSGTGQYPSSGYGTSFDSTKSLADASYFELQYLNGRFQDPPAVNYTARTPAGPDYSSLSYDSHNDMRWATFSLGSVSSVTSVDFTIAGAQNFGGTTIVSGIELYVRVDGATPTTGWVNANLAYPGVGNPTANGDAALDVGGSSATSKRVTFGAAVKTGTVYVRIGIPQSSNKSFTGIS